MKSLGVSGYAAADVEKALLASGRTWDFRYERYDKNNAFQGNFNNVTSGSVDHSAFADIVGTAKFSMKDIEGSGINWISDRCKPIVRLKISPTKWAEWPMGLFLLSSPAMTAQKNAQKIREIDAYDQSFILIHDKVTSRYYVAAGSLVTTTIASILTIAGITLQTIVPSTLTMPTDRDWDPATPKLVIINNLLNAINYQSLWFDGDGYAVCRPYLSPSNAPTGYTYKDDTSSMLTPEGSRTLDLFDVPNKWVLFISDPDRASIRSEYTNNASGSPTSVVNRGFTIVDYREESEIVDQETLDSRVARIAYESSQVYEKVVISTGIMPMHEHMDVIALRYGRLDIDDRYQETDWTMTLKAGATMSHSLRRLVQI